jgi:hypothetical protein
VPPATVHHHNTLSLWCAYLTTLVFQQVNVGKEDKEFDPSAEMMVNDFDDEQTLEEEEAMEATEDTHQELDNLKEVSAVIICSIFCAQFRWFLLVNSRS